MHKPREEWLRSHCLPVVGVMAGVASPLGTEIEVMEDIGVAGNAGIGLM